MGFYKTIVSLLEDVRTFDYVRSTLLYIANAHYQQQNQGNSECEEQSVNSFICSSCDVFVYSYDSVIVCSLCLNLDAFYSSTLIDSFPVSCSQCYKYDSNDCDFYDLPVNEVTL